MSLEQASLVSQIVSAVAILASLVFLGLQIRSNTLALRSQAYFNGMSHGQRPFELMIEDKELTKIVGIGYETPEALTDVERERFNLHSFMLFNAWEYFYYQHQDGSIPEQLFLGSDEHMKHLVRTKPGLSPFWQEFQHAYVDPFRSYVTNEFPAE